MEVIAEGVETFEQVTYLRDQGVRAAQGFLFAPPLSIRPFLSLVEAMGGATSARDGVIRLESP